MSTARGDLTWSDLLSQLPTHLSAVSEEIELKKAMYAMLTDGTALMTEEGKYRLRTLLAD